MGKKRKNSWVDFRLIKEKITLPMVLEHYGIQLKKRPGGELVGVCPLHGTANYPADNPTAFGVSKDGRAWKCFTRCRDPAGGNVLDFVMRKESVDVWQAGELLASWFPLAENASNARKASGANAVNEHGKQPKVKPVNKILDFMLRLQRDVPFLLEAKGLTMNTIKKFGLGYCAKGMHAGRIVIPVHNTEGQLVTYAGRSLDQSEVDEGRKYYFPRTFHKQVELYNLHRVLQIPKLVEKRGIVVVEGFFDVIKLWQHGVYNAVAIMGTALTHWQEELLLSYTDKVTLMLDNNTAGREATEKICGRLIGKVFLKVPKYPPDKEQPEDLSKEELRQMLGLGEIAEEK